MVVTRPCHDPRSGRSLPICVRTAAHLVCLTLTLPAGSAPAANVAVGSNKSPPVCGPSRRVQSWRWIAFAPACKSSSRPRPFGESQGRESQGQACVLHFRCCHQGCFIESQRRACPLRNGAALWHSFGVQSLHRLSTQPCAPRPWAMGFNRFAVFMSPFADCQHIPCRDNHSVPKRHRAVGREAGGEGMEPKVVGYHFLTRRERRHFAGFAARMRFAGQ
jgi:hypothetical protein